MQIRLQNTRLIMNSREKEKPKEVKSIKKRVEEVIFFVKLNSDRDGQHIRYPEEQVQFAKNGRMGTAA